MARADYDNSGVTAIDRELAGQKLFRDYRLEQFAEGLPGMIIPADHNKDFSFEDWLQKARISEASEKVIKDLHLTGKGP